MRILVITIGIAILLLITLKVFLKPDFSQEYRNIPSVERIVFQANGKVNSFYKRCFWGLKSVDEPNSFAQNNIIISDSEWDVLQKLVGRNEIREALLSLDGNYILYCEIEYNYKKTGLTDDEYCYYRVYNIETEEVVTIYEAYREWYNLSWE